MELAILGIIAPYLLGILLFMAASLAAHEFGHFRAADKMGFEPRWVGSWKPLKVGIRTNGKETLKDSRIIIEKGIMAGLFMACVSFVFLGWWGLVVLAGYVWGCIGDVKLLKRIRREMKFRGDLNGAEKL